jgi:cardiolipin synthase
MISSVYSAHNRVELLRGGKAYFDQVRALIREAEYSVHLQTYIFGDDATGKMVADELMKAAQRGVHVFMLLDGYASQHLSAELIKELKKSGIHFRWFEPLFHSRHFYFGRRLHHKVLVTDGARALVGGINIADRYNDLPGIPAWLDWALFVEGEACMELFHVCQELWNRSGWGKKRNERYYADVHRVFSGPECLVRVRRNDWVRKKNQISRSYIEMLAKAQSHIIIMSSYFIPGHFIRNQLMKAAKRGVKIKVITAGKSDVWLSKNAERYMYRWLLKNNIEIYEYETNVLHAKMSTYDGKWVTVGSYNVNNISAYASIELNLDVLDEPFAREVETKIKEVCSKDCMRVTSEVYLKQFGFFIRLWQKICYHIFRFLVFLFTFYFKQER